MNIFTTLPGRCLISFNTDEDEYYKIGMKFGIIIPDIAKRKAQTAFVHLHTRTNSWDEVDLTGKTVVVDRWASRPFAVNHEGKEYNFAIISQWRVLGIVEEPQLQPGDPDFCGFCRGKCKGEHYISPSTGGY